MHAFPPAETLRPLILLARDEDLGSGDVTSRLMVAEEAPGVGTFMQRGPGISCGLPIVEMVCRAYDERLRVEPIPGFHFEVIEGRYTDQESTPLVRVRGPMRSLLSAERVILNFVQRTSGIATLTHRYVRRVTGTGAQIFDTRKTLPGHRLLDKYAVLCGGGQNHRIGLYDGLLIKDNHLAGLSLPEIAPFVGRAVARCLAEDPSRLVEVEVDRLDQLAEVLKVAGVQVVLLDNMDCPTMVRAVQMRDGAGKKGQIRLEASGGVTLDSVREIAATGVERISVGALTHSAPAMDIGLDVEPG